MYTYLNDGSGIWEWVSDRGTKAVRYSSYLGYDVHLHMRLYAPAQTYFWSVSWGRFVIATAHYDERWTEWWHGYSEYAENDLAVIAKAKGYTVSEDLYYLYNPEAYREEGTWYVDLRIWLNDGYATTVDVP